MPVEHAPIEWAGDGMGNAAQGLFYPYSFLGYPADLYWLYKRWLPYYFWITVTVNVVKVTIKLRERQAVFYLVNLLNWARGKLQGLSGVVDTVLLTIFTFDIDYTVTTYTYSIIV